MKVEVLASSGNDLLVVNAARVSFSKESEKFSDKDGNLLRYLAENKHWLPFRHPQITLRCKAPLFCARQLGKHQVGFSWSEESRRYIKSDPEFYWPDKWRKAAENVKQGSSDEALEELDNGDPVDERTFDVMAYAVQVYQHMLASGIAPEQARMILPQNMYVSWVWTGSLLGWAQLVKQRTEAHAQRETQEFARKIEQVVAPLYPESWKNLMMHL